MMNATKIETSDEWLCTIKTHRAIYEKVEAAIRELHTYDEPEIIGVFHHTPRYVRAALSLISSGQIDADGLITHEMGLERLEESDPP